MTGEHGGPYLFVSYASADRERVLPIVARLEAAGVRAWIDRDGIHGGANYAQVISDAIKGAAALLLFASPASLASRNVRQELALGWRFEKPYLPLRLDPVEIPDDLAYWLEGSQWIELLDRPESRWLAELTKALQPYGIALRLAPPSPVLIHERPLLVGREREQGVLREHLDRMLAGQGSVVLVGGEAGIGKTTLVEDLSVQAEEAGCLALWGHAYDLSVTPPYGPWLELFRQYRDLDLDLPPLPPFILDPDELTKVGSQGTFFAAVADFLKALAAQHPLMLVLDDLHWFDQASLDFFRFLARQVAGEHLLLVTTYRTDELHRRHPLYTLLPLLVREAGAERLEVMPLTETGHRALIASRYQLSAGDGVRLERYLEDHAEGNPLYAGELLRTLEETGALVVAGDGWQLGDLEQARVPPLLRQVIEGRLARLPDETRTLLDIAAVIGQTVPLALWETVGQVDELRLLGAAEAAEGAAVLAATPDGTGVYFRHALLREALYENILPLRRRVWHRTVAEALTQTSRPDPDVVAYHFLQAGDSRAAEWLIKAGARAQLAYAWPTAAARFEAALAKLTEQEAPMSQRAALLFRIAHLQRYVDPPRTVMLMDEVRTLAIEANEPALAARSLHVSGMIRFWLGDVARSLREMEQADTEFYALPQADQARTWTLLDIDGDAFSGPYVAILALVGLFDDAFKLGQREITEAARPSLRVGQGESQYADGLLGLAFAAAFGGYPERARTLFQQARAIYQTIEHHQQLAYSCHMELELIQLPYFPDEQAARRRLESEAEAASRSASGARSVEVTNRYRVAANQVLEGDWRQARETATSLIGIPSWLGRMYGARWLAPLAAWQGDTELAQRVIREVLPDGSETALGTTYFPNAQPLQRLAAEMALDSHDLPTAHTWLEAHDRWLGWSGAVLGRAEGALLWAEYHHANGDAAQARASVEQALAHASEPRQPLALIAVHRFLGQLDTSGQQFDTAEEHLQQSLQLAEACAAPFERALTLLTLARLRTAQGKPDEARTFLDEVRAICEPLGAGPTLEKAADLSRELTEAGDDDA